MKRHLLILIASAFVTGGSAVLALMELATEGRLQTIIAGILVSIGSALTCIAQLKEIDRKSSTLER